MSSAFSRCHLSRRQYRAAEERVACAPDATPVLTLSLSLSLSLCVCVSWTGGFQPRERNAAVGRCRTMCVSALPAGMIHRGLIELSNIDIPVKTARVYAVMVPAPLYIILYPPPDSIHSPFVLCPPHSFNFSNFICVY